MDVNTPSNRFVNFFVFCFSINGLHYAGTITMKMILILAQTHVSGLDVVRTDRTLVFYEKKENLSKLWDILSVYAKIDSDVGYGQGEFLNFNLKYFVLPHLDFDQHRIHHYFFRSYLP